MQTFKEFLAAIKAAEHMSAGIETLSFTNKNGKKFTFEFNDLHRSLQAIWVNSQFIESQFKGDWEYEETKFRQAFSIALQDETHNSVASALGSQTSNTVRCLEIYAFFLLQKSPTGNLGTPDILKGENLNPLFYGQDLREEFRAWLLEIKQLSEKSADSYAGAVAGVLSRFAGKDLFKVTAPSVYEAVKALLNKNADFNKLNGDGNQMYSAALNNYTAFLVDRMKTPPIVTFSPHCKSAFLTDLNRSGFNNLECEPENLIFSLITKPFVILTGNSGTGKTKLSELFSRWLCAGDDSQIALIPVGSDWTDNRHVLGFVNHLRPSSTSQPIYESTPILELILRAKNDRTRPYFLILDEMNLSHVERYFADFLSAMESGRAIPLHTSASDLLSPQGTQVPASLNLPDNLFITGTVNVDETTYMFSPKVLDRANVIEFRVSPGDARAFLTAGAGGIGEINPAPAGAAEAFLALARKARQKPTPDLMFFTDAQLKTKRETLAQSLVGLFGLMHTHKLEFGYRTMNEVLRYAGVDYELAAERAAWAWETCLDVQILQKVLPKLHGSKKRIEPLLVDLAAFCETGAVPAQGKAVFTTRATGKVTFPDSYQKLADMIEIVRRDQFVSFI